MKGESAMFSVQGSMSSATLRSIMPGMMSLLKRGARAHHKKMERRVNGEMVKG